MLKIKNSNNKNVLVNKNNEIISKEYDVIFLDSSAPYLYICHNDGFYNILLNQNTNMKELLNQNTYIQIEPIYIWGETEDIYYFEAKKENGLYDFIAVNINNSIEILFNDIEDREYIGVGEYILKINNLEYIVYFTNKKAIILDNGFNKIINLHLSNLNSYGIDSNGKYKYFYFDKTEQEFKISEILTDFDNGSEYLGGGVLILEKDGYKGMFILDNNNDLVQLTNIEFLDIIYQYSTFTDNYYKFIDKHNNEWLYNLYNNENTKELIKVDKN